ncbi:kinesin-domain-containing protein [Gloeophyllum trabeum ATCC 11539]|uniref:Kinesin-like protein n=1 Tax=Gloeophyllum trabeum (strain ATCC 11539 / FP-39264 / Madison 617) TaxID=670483 RepID=S7PWQ5_GLOTA|nr:kinesin-domain-containing protein [Gloeophyllum trabeum ATCC 11539]EPQ52051.1 kinesin-domain-containing protein [Gloeophyllum trabeum ATCC 11539]
MAHKVKIAARLRPRIGAELEDDSIQVVNEDGGSCICVVNPRDPNSYFRFPFSSCYDQSSTQEEIFENDVRPLIDVAFHGVTVTIFAYGVTSSGKTHTMQGTKAEPGVIPRVVRALVDQKSALPPGKVSLAASYYEIYRDDVYDLFVQRDQAPKLPVRENDVGQVFVANLSTEPIDTYADFDALFSRANKQRSVGATNLNRASSRSHAILSMEITMRDEDKILTGKINLVDLAGSENNKLTGNDATRMAESAAINKSLSVLGQVVHALNQGASRIPYRNSKLTRILQDALGGSSVGLLICNLAPGAKFRQDTLNTLNFAVRTKNVENKPVVNERDNAPPPRRHFAAAPPPAPKLAPAALPPAFNSTAGHSRQSLAGPSRVPRPSMAMAGRPSIAPVHQKTRQRAQAPPPSTLVTLSESEIDARIAKAVEAEVARRLAAAEQARREEEEERSVEQELSRSEEGPSVSGSTSMDSEKPIPSGILTPLLKRHKDLDDELRQRLQDLEKKFERSSKELQLVDVLSPVSRKKTGRAYVALARAHSEKGNLQVALELYRKAETYVPDNMKLKERIIEIEWAVKNGKEFQPSPKKAKKPKGKKRSRSKGPKQARQPDPAGQDENADPNVLEEAMSKIGKRPVGELGEGDDVSVQTPPKKMKTGFSVLDGIDEAQEVDPPVLGKKGQKRLESPL